MIEYDVIRHPNGKVRLIENLNGVKRFVNKGKTKFLDDDEMADFILEQGRKNERKAKYWLACEKNRKMKVNI